VAELPKEFFTLQSVLTLGGATGATFLIANGLQRAFDFNPKWLALAIALVLSLFGVYFTGGAGSDYFIGVINGFLIYATTVGATTTFGSPPPTTSSHQDGRDALPRHIRRRFLSRWY